MNQKPPLNKNIKHLSKSWNLSTINDFLDRVDEIIKNIVSNPKLYTVYRKKDGVHKCVIGFCL